MKSQTLVCPSVQVTHKCQGIFPIWVFAINRTPFISLRLFLSHPCFCPTLYAIPLGGGNTEGREQERAAGVTAFWDEHVGVQVCWCGGDERSVPALWREAVWTEEAPSALCHGVRRGSQTGLGVSGIPDPEPHSHFALGCCQESGAPGPSHPKQIPALPSPPRPGCCCHRLPQPGPGALGPAPPERPVPALPSPEHAPERPRAQPPARWFPEPPGRSSPARRSLSAIFPQAGPAAPHLPPPRTPKPPAAIFEQGTPAGAVVPGAVTRRSGPCRPPSCSRRHVCPGRALPAHTGEGWVCAKGRGGVEGRDRRPSPPSPGGGSGERGRNTAPTPVSARPPV